MAKTIGLYGTGRVAKRGITRFIPSHLGEDKGRFLFLVDEAWGDSLDRLLDFAVESGDPLCIVKPGDEFIEDLKGDSIPYLESDTPYDTFLDTLREEGGDLVLLWDDSNEENEAALTSMAEDAFQEGLAVYDLAHGMRPLELGDETPDEETETPEAAEEPVDEAPEAEDDPYEAFLDRIDAAESPDDWDALFLHKDHRDHLVRLGEELHLDFNPSSWQKRIAPVVKDALMENETFLKNDIRTAIEAASPPEAPFKEEHISQKVSRENHEARQEKDVETIKPEEPAEAPTADEVRRDEEAVRQSLQEHMDQLGTGATVTVKSREEEDRKGISLEGLEALLDQERQNAIYDKQDLRHALCRVAERQGVEEAEKFLEFLKDNDLA